MNKNLYILLLDNSKIFLHACLPNNKSDIQIMLEAEIQYVYLKKYKPIKIIETLTNIEMIDIDRNVKKYMIFCGIANVRGGTYCNIILPDYQEKTLMSEFETIIIDEKYNQLSECLVNSYVNTKFTKQDACIEIERLETNLDNYKKDMYALNQIKINIQEITNDIQWLMNICNKQVDAFANNKKETLLYSLEMKYNITKYREILITMRKIYHICTNVLDIQNSEVNYVFIKYPHFLLDDFFYHWNRIHLPQSIDDVYHFYNTYIYFLNLIENKIAEREFDANSWESDIEWKTPRAIFLLKKMT